MTEKEQRYIFDDWLSQHKLLIFKVVRAYASTAMDKDDLFQDIIIQVWRSVTMFREESSVTTWLYRISLNTAIKWVRKKRKHDHAEMPEQLQQILWDSGADIDERLYWLYEEISRLDVIDRSIILLFLDDFSYKEIAAILGITESNVGVRINRIKKNLVSKSKK